MRILIFSDIHGNLPALEYVLKIENNADLIICLGDVVNYGPWSNECVDLLQTLKHKVLIKGNHEEAFMSGIYPGKNQITKAFFDFCYPTFNRRNLINKYIQDYTFLNYQFVHTLNDHYIYPDTEIELNKNVFIGHSHRLFYKEINNFKLINVGSLGQNRLNIDEVNYVLWDSSSDKIELVTKSFSADLIINEMKNKNYPEICLNYILSKRKSN